METNQKVTYGLIGLLSLIVATMGGTQFLTEDQLDNAYVCTVNENVGIFDHLSSTMKTGYWSDNTGDHSKVCRGGIWMNLKQYAEENNIEINVLLNQVNEEKEIIKEIPINIQAGMRFKCDSNKCERVN